MGSNENLENLVRSGGLKAEPIHVWTRSDHG